MFWVEGEVKTNVLEGILWGDSKVSHSFPFHAFGQIRIKTIFIQPFPSLINSMYRFSSAQHCSSKVPNRLRWSAAIWIWRWSRCRISPSKSPNILFLSCIHFITVLVSSKSPSPHVKGLLGITNIRNVTIKVGTADPMYLQQIKGWCKQTLTQSNGPIMDSCFMCKIILNTEYIAKIR